MKINIKNREKIQGTLDATNGRAEAQTITYAPYLADIVKRAESDLASRGVSKKERAGCGLEFVPVGPSKAYKYGYKTTRLVLTRGSKDWFLVECESFEGWPGQGEIFNLRVTETALDQIKRYAMRGLVSVNGAPLPQAKEAL